MTTGSSFSQTGAVSPSTFSVRQQIIQSLRTAREYRRGFVEEKIQTGLAVQMKAIRESRPGMTQQKFAELLGKSQSWVARLEDPNAPPPTITTLLKVAAAFDVDLVVRYAPFSETIDWVSGNPHVVPGLSPESLAVPDFENDTTVAELVRIEIPKPDLAPAALNAAASCGQTSTEGPVKANAEIGKQGQLSLGLLPPNVVIFRGQSSVELQSEEMPGSILGGVTHGITECRQG